MQQPERRPPDDDFEVNLEWPPGDGDDGEPGGDEPTGPHDATGPQRSARPRSSGAGHRSAADERVWAYDAPTVESPSDVGAPVVDGLRLGRIVVDGLERLASLLLERFRVLREEIDTDLADVRNQLAGLRSAIEESSDRRPLRAVEDAVRDLEQDVAGLRAAVLEWPDLEQVTGDVAALRADVATLLDQPLPPAGRRAAVAPAELEALRAQLAELAAAGPAAGAPAGEAEVDRLHDLLEQLRDDVGELAGEVTSLRTDAASLRRRVALRAQPEAPRLSEAQLEQVVDALAQRILGSIGAD